MSQIVVTLEDRNLIIKKERARQTEKDIQIIDIDTLKFEKKYQSKIKITNNEQKNEILFMQKIERMNYEEQQEEIIENNELVVNEKTIENDDILENEAIIESEDTEEVIEDEDIIENENTENINIDNSILIVYTEKGKIKYSFCSIKKLYKNLVKIKYKVLGLSLNKRKIKVKILAYIVNKYNLEYGEQKFYIDNAISANCTLKEYPKQISKFKMITGGNIYNFKFDVDEILKDESPINNAIKFTINIDNIEVPYKIAKKKKHIKNTKYYYNPIKGVYVKDFALHIRRSASGCLVFVKRLKDPIEDTLKFKMLENKPISIILYYTGKFLSHFRKKKINIFYEKFSSKVEEGAFDLFLLFQQYKNTKNYFVIDKNSPDYEKIKHNKGIVKKYSLKYYWVIYNAKNCIATEAPSHLNIIRSNNGILRKSFADKRFIFLQHGVTYLKCHGKNSTFVKGKEGEVDYIIAGSEKEKDAIVDMLKIKEEHVLKTGLPIFSKIEHKHINKNSEDYVAIMLTWKPYEEYLYNFEESGTYKNTIAVCNMLKKYIDTDKIIVTTHPKAYDLIANTDLRDSLWKEPVSKLLEKAKLLITDYSSISYNSFYQGAGVIFFQPDLELFESDNGKLVPNDEEYIGKRVFNIEQLEEIIKDTIIDKKIDLDKIRTKENEEMYKTINEFSDGKNIERIYEELLNLNII